jgi:hypothetical protein
MIARVVPDTRNASRTTQDFAVALRASGSAPTDLSYERW